MLFVFVGILLLLLALSAWVVDLCYLHRHAAALFREIFFLFHALLAAGLLVAVLAGGMEPQAMSYKGRFLSVLVCIVVPELLAMVLLIPTIFMRRTHHLRQWWKLGTFLCSALLCAVAVYGFTAGYQKVTVVPFDYASDRIPKAFDGYRIVQLSDLHVGTVMHNPGVVEKIVARTNALNPDLIVFTGDLVNCKSEELDGFRHILSRLSAKDGVVSIMGNHDYMMYYRWPSDSDRLADILALQEGERAMGWKLLLNENAIVRRGDDSIAIVGVENYGSLERFPKMADLDAAQRGLTDTCFQILLSHDPSHWRHAVIPDTDIPLTLSGHTHAMQIKIGNFSPAKYLYPEWGGRYDMGGQTIYVNIGVGQVMLPFRLGAWPEVTLLTLHCR